MMQCRNHFEIFKYKKDFNDESHERAWLTRVNINICKTYSVSEGCIQR